MFAKGETEVSDTPKKPADSGSEQPAGKLSDDSGLSERLEQLGTRLEVRRKESEKPETKDTSSTAAGLAQGMKLSSEFIAAIFVGAGTGFLIDKFAGTSPWGLIVFLFLGFGAGVLNALRAAGLVAESNLHLGAEVKRKNDE